MNAETTTKYKLAASKIKEGVKDGLTNLLSNKGVAGDDIKVIQNVFDSPVGSLVLKHIVGKLEVPNDPRVNQLLNFL